MRHLGGLIRVILLALKLTMIGPSPMSQFYYRY